MHPIAKVSAEFFIAAMGAPASQYRKLTSEPVSESFQEGCGGQIPGLAICPVFNFEF